MKIAVLTSSRADYGFLKPLLTQMYKDDFFQPQIITFGTHQSAFYGNTYQHIENDGFVATKNVDSILINHTPEAIATSMGLTTIKFASIWADFSKNKEDKIDLILCLGDRYEMFAAIAASLPFNIPIAHLSGGETTLGAIDDAFRNSLTIMSAIHFTNTQANAQRVKEIKGSDKNVFFVGSLAIDNINTTNLLSIEEFKEKNNIDLSIPTILVSFHPETVNIQKNEYYAQQVAKSLEELSKDFQIIITMPNADTMSNVIREAFVKIISKKYIIHTVESLGSVGYYSCLQNACFLIGNSSSGIVEAASFGKYVINLGDRQKGREAANNVIHCIIEQEEILNNAFKISKLPTLKKENIYGDGNTTNRICSILKEVSL